MGIFFGTAGKLSASTWAPALSATPVPTFRFACRWAINFASYLSISRKDIPLYHIQPWHKQTEAVCKCMITYCTIGKNMIWDMGNPSIVHPSGQHYGGARPIVAYVEQNTVRFTSIVLRQVRNYLHMWCAMHCYTAFSMNCSYICKVRHYVTPQCVANRTSAPSDATKGRIAHLQLT